MRTVLVAVKPMVLSRQSRQVPILGHLTSAFFYEQQIETMRAFPAGTSPLTVVIWDSDTLPDEVRESSLEAGLVLRLYDKCQWECTDAGVAILTAYKKHARLLMKHLGKKGVVLTINAIQGIEKTSGMLSCGRHDGGTGFLKDGRRMCVGFSRLRDDMSIVAHASFAKQTRTSKPTSLWTHMYKV